MNELIQYILDLFTNPGAAQAFVSGPGQAMTDAGLVNVAPDVFSSAVASAMPGVDLGPGDPIGGLQQVSGRPVRLRPRLWGLRLGLRRV